MDDVTMHGTGACVQQTLLDATITKGERKYFWMLP
jgi:hypothetical protein